MASVDPDELPARVVTVPLSLLSSNSMITIICDRFVPSVVIPIGLSKLVEVPVASVDPDELLKGCYSSRKTKFNSLY